MTDIKINVYKPCSAALSPSWGFSNTIIWPPLVWLRLRGGPKVSFLRKKGHSQQRFGGTVPTAFQHPGPAFLGDPWCATRPFWKTGVFAPGSSPDSVMAPSQPPGKGRGRTSAPGIRCAAASPAGGPKWAGLGTVPSHTGGWRISLGRHAGKHARWAPRFPRLIGKWPCDPGPRVPWAQGSRIGRGRGRPRGCAPPGLGSASRGRSPRRAAVSLRRRPGRRFIASGQRGATARTPRGLRVASPCCPGRRAGEAPRDARLSGDAVPAPRVKGVGSGRAEVAPAVPVLSPHSAALALGPRGAAGAQGAALPGGRCRLSASRCSRGAGSAALLRCFRVRRAGGRANAGEARVPAPSAARARPPA